MKRLNRVIPMVIFAVLITLLVGISSAFPNPLIHTMAYGESPSILLKGGLGQTLGYAVLFKHKDIIKLILFTLAGAGAIAGFIFCKARGWISLFSQEVQALPDNKRRGIPTVLKGIFVALVVVRLIFSLSALGDKPYNADEVRGFYRLSGYSRSEVLASAFQGDSLNALELRAYQTPNEEKSLGDALSSLTKNPEHPPLYYLLARFCMQIWNQPVTARILAILLGAAYLPLAYWLCLELFRCPWTGWLAVALLSVSPYHILLTLGAREYSLWTLWLLASSIALLRAIRLGKRSHWVLYAATVGIGFYSHLFFAFSLIAHGIYVLMCRGQKWYSHRVPFLLSSGTGLLIFSPWIVVLVSQPDVIQDNTQWVRGRNSNLSSIIRGTIDHIGNVFIDFDNTTRLEGALDLLMVFLAALTLYSLIRNTPFRTWAFLLLPILVTALCLIIPDLLEGGGRSLKARYLIPAFLPITFAIAYFLANGIRFSKQPWERLTSASVLSILLVFGVVSGGRMLKNPGWDYLDQGRTASLVNLEIAPIINQSANPLIISDATHSFVLALSHEVNSDTEFQLLQDLPPDQWSTLVDIPGSLKRYSDVFVYFPSPDLLAFVEGGSDRKLLPLLNNSLYQLVS